MSPIPLGAGPSSSALSLARSLLGPSLVALAAYGSQVAGYATEESDYDLLAVVRGSRERARYFYAVAPGGINASVLAVRDDSLVGDAERGELGEFVAGRLLNPYEVLEDGDGVLDRAARSYRRRVAVEELLELAYRYGPFSAELLMPPSYFLFSKLRRRAKIYPPARYSYVRTYSGPMGRENVEWASGRFEEALDGLAAEGVLEAAGRGPSGQRYYRLRSLPPSPRWRVPELATLSLAVRQYMTHVRSGRVSPAVFLSELLSKTRRARRTWRMAELEGPESFLSLPEGSLSFQGLAPLVPEGCRGRELPVGEFYSTVKLLEVYCPPGSGAARRLIVKDYNSPWAIKWIMARVMAAGIREMKLTSMERLTSEYRFTRLLRSAGFRTPAVELVDPGRAIMARGYAEGVVLERALGDEAAFEEVGRLMGTLHTKLNVTLGDVKPSNFLVRGRDIYVLDCEQASYGGNRAWDVASFVYFLAPLGRRLGYGAFASSARAFLRGYAGAGDLRALADAPSPRLAAPLAAVLQPGEAKLASQLMLEFSSQTRQRQAG